MPGDSSEKMVASVAVANWTHTHPKLSWREFKVISSTFRSTGVKAVIRRGKRTPFEGLSASKGTPFDGGFTMAPVSYGILGFGDGREDPPRVFRQKKTIKAICRELRVSRKVLRAEAIEFPCEHGEPASTDRPLAGRTRGPDTEVRFMHAGPGFYVKFSLTPQRACRRSPGAILPIGNQSI